jgi:hypothetical protein
MALSPNQTAHFPFLVWDPHIDEYERETASCHTIIVAKNTYEIAYVYGLPPQRHPYIRAKTREKAVCFS